LVPIQRYRHFMELKYFISIQAHNVQSCFNRTFMELK